MGISFAELTTTAFGAPEPWTPLFSKPASADATSDWSGRMSCAES